MTIVILILISVVIVFLLQAKKEYKEADKNINSLILEAANATSIGDYNKAIQLLTSALHQNTMYHNLWNSRGENYMKLKMYEQALADFNKSISINPDRHINYTAYTNIEKVEKIISSRILTTNTTNDRKKLTLFDIKLNEECIYEISNMRNGQFNTSAGNFISNFSEEITINLKDKTVTFGGVQNLLVLPVKQYAIISKSFNSEHSIEIIHLTEIELKEYIGSKYTSNEQLVRVNLLFSNNGIGYHDRFEHGAFFNYSSEWVIKKH